MANKQRTKNADLNLSMGQLTKGLILLESPPSLFIASRIQARSTTAGTPVKS